LQKDDSQRDKMETQAYIHPEIGGRHIRLIVLDTKTVGIPES
jgi:hypothetical protein